MPIGAFAALAGAMASRHASHSARVAQLRAEGKDVEADELEKCERVRVYQQGQDFRAIYSDRMAQDPRFKIHQLPPRVYMPIPELLRENNWWPWLVVEMWIQLWLVM